MAPSLPWRDRAFERLGHESFDLLINLDKEPESCALANALVWDAGSIEPDEVARQREALTIESLSRA